LEYRNMIWNIYGKEKTKNSRDENFLKI